MVIARVGTIATVIALLATLAFVVSPFRYAPPRDTPGTDPHSMSVRDT